MAVGVGAGRGDRAVRSRLWPPPKGPHTIELHVHGMAVHANRAKVYAVLTAYPGVTKARVDADGYAAIRVADGQATSAEALVQAIEDAGYEAHTGEH